MDLCLLFIFAVFIFLASVVLRIVYVHILSRIISRRKDLVNDYGPWAVVTGSSDGIGKCYAKELAKRGMKIVLISNEEGKLHSVANEIRNEFDVETKVIFADFSQGEDEYHKIFSEIEDLDIGILVNNVGTAGGLPKYFVNMSRQQTWTIMMVNVCAATSMSHFILPKMRSRGRGLIINIASAASLAPTPFGTLYGASKAYMRSFSEALEFECKGTGVDVQTVCPCFVKTQIMGEKAFKLPSSFSYPLPEDFAKNAVATIGKTSFTAGCLAHEIQFHGLQLIPRRVLTWLLSKFVNIMKVSKRQE